MKKIRKILFVFLLIMGVICLSAWLLFKHFTSAVGGSNEIIEVVIPENSSGEKIGKILEEKELIRSTTFFKIYLKVNNIKKLNNGSYKFNKEMSLEEIVDELQKTNYNNEDEISITFKEGINMRELAKVIAANTVNSEDDVMKLFKDTEYLKKLINDYWFITDAILDSKIYYPLEGYLFPNTYRFINKNVTVKEIFEKLLKQMDSVLTPHKAEIENSKYNVHEILTLASMVEKEIGKNEEYRKNVASVFINRLKRGMSLGSDVTTRYSLKIDDAKKVLTKSQYASVSAYNTRSSTMAGKLPAGPISTISEGSILAVLNAPETDYIYFIANIQTGETFFYSNAREFEAKKAELANINGGL